MDTKFHRILLKLSGESLMGAQGHGIDPQRLAMYAGQIAQLTRDGVQIAIVIGGGNIFRGVAGAAAGFDRVKGDQMGMLATIINSLALSNAIAATGTPVKVYTSIAMAPIGEPYSPDKAIASLEAGTVAIIGGGTGLPYFTTDTTSVLRALEVKAQVMLKGTRVDGIYTADPEKDPSATKFDRISFDEIYRRGLKIMDLTATTMSRDNGLNIIVFDMDTPGNLLKVLSGDNIGTLVY